MNNKFKFFYEEYFLHFIFLIILLSTFSYWYYINFVPKHSIQYYYTLVHEGEKVNDEETFTAVELNKLSNCDKNQYCYKDFFREFNDTHSMRESFSKLALLVKQDQNNLEYCHQIAHGIGISEYYKNNKDLGVSLENFSKIDFFSNKAICGGGYYHGIIEESAKDIKDKEKLLAFFKNTCNSKIILNLIGNDCIHGVGHAVFLQVDFNLEDAIFVCNGMTDDKAFKFLCHAGLFMEFNERFPSSEIVKKNPDNTLDFYLCNEYSDTEVRNACIFESSIIFRSELKDKNDFFSMLKMCRQFQDSLERMSCMKFVVTWGIIKVNYSDINKLCKSGTNSREERIICVGIFAHRLAASIVGKDLKRYFEIANDICKYLGPFEQVTCRDLIRTRASSMYAVIDEDLNI